MSKVVDLTMERLERGPAVTRFTLEARDAGRRRDGRAYAWRWFIEDNEGAKERGDKPPSRAHIAATLRRIADRYDPPRRRRPRVVKAP